MDWSRMAQDYGLIGIVMTAFITFLGFIIKWILGQFKIELEANRIERKDYLDALHAIRTEVTEHNIRSKECWMNVNAEHKEMIQTLGRINGYKHE